MKQPILSACLRFQSEHPQLFLFPESCALRTSTKCSVWNLQVCTLMAGEIGPAETAAFNLVSWLQLRFTLPPNYPSEHPRLPLAILPTL